MSLVSVGTIVGVPVGKRVGKGVYVGGTGLGICVRVIRADSNVAVRTTGAVTFDTLVVSVGVLHPAGSTSNTITATPRYRRSNR